MSHMNQDHAQLVNLPCVCCGRPLTDAESMSRLIGPDCFKKYGNGLTHLKRPDRLEANQMILGLGALSNALEIEGSCMVIESKFPTLAGLTQRVKKRFGAKIKKAHEERKLNTIKAVGERLYFPYKRGVRLGDLLRGEGFKCRGGNDGEWYWVIEKPSDIARLSSTIGSGYPNFKVVNDQGVEVDLADHLKVSDSTPRMKMEPDGSKVLVNLSIFSNDANLILKRFGAKAKYEAQDFKGWVLPVNTPWDHVKSELTKVYGSPLVVN